MIAAAASVQAVAPRAPAPHRPPVAVKLYVCWGTYREPFHQHPCRAAHRALLAAGHRPELVKVRGLGVGPRLFHRTTRGRREVEELSGQRVVPVLLTDQGQVLIESAAIVAWAAAHPQPPPTSGADHER